ncbi:bifunctional phosphopantothenoylcysteine decarboxylase/phosphopantothenate--cysteine ligase CoaBC [Paraneptunicella aestuarii]|uniref:bifunctional phosphopantothenoylcysteine decarboxylase/phosphopantothenate--cysteine ligase CoaBC n=1 Tax=Paraneptunicella aestuarii TaxID=2831148 RepID=UPI001E3FB9A0|nr:bifunctional phosphopantothenoylcysteine decarboxylase/phosphopantothenate--cysteine ligase CoaBC [Paraneptunicella aestuarii]UAA38844.1 bifunctional phosphopantothenoylcysteine decarboxylase/phosphopantothenate--cysteine ligase CoaBC [Paraneptunicella aestuarii]
MTSLQNFNVLLGITGGIAAYKTPDLVRKLKAQGANVRVVVTESAKSFVSPLALQAVSGNTVSDNILDPAAEAAMGHIELARWADILLVAPATANFIAKLANGLADDLLSTLCLATNAPIYIAPAMNQQMWFASATVENMQILETRGIGIFGPDQGEQACGEVGPGRMMEPEQLVSELGKVITHPILKGKRITITAGPTREHIDPVRYITNHSSGKMGYALARAAKLMGAEVTLVSGPVNITAPNVDKLHKVVTAEDMLNTVMKDIKDCDIFIGCAAVADYRPTESVDHKIKKSNIELTLTFVRNPDILASVAALKDGPFTVGFAAETQNVSEYAKDKLQRKKLDMIAANDVSQRDIGFNSDDNRLHVFWKSGDIQLDKADKLTLATQLLQLISEHFNDAQN